MEAEKVKNYLLQVQRPQTLEEVAEGVPLGVSEAESTLVQLLSDASIVSLDLKESEDSSVIYWRRSPACILNKWSQVEASHKILKIQPPSQRSRMPFKSPARTPNPATVKSRLRYSRKTKEDINSTAQKLVEDIQKLRVKLGEVEGDMKELAVDDYHEDELQLHIDKLHEYNEIKDIGQVLLGKLAEVEGTTTATLYEKFGLGLDD